MSREWKPGDVALVEAGCWANRKVALRLAEGWSHTNGVNVDGDGVIVVVHPLVVIDPEDREAVERLAEAVLAEASGYRIDKAILTVGLSNALREFANPTPPRPDEPLGLGAVVEDAEGGIYTRYETDREPQPWWQSKHGPEADVVRRFGWEDIAAVRVLSEGVQP